MIRPAFVVLVAASVASAQTIVCPPGAPALVKLAAKEVRRFVYSVGGWRVLDRAGSPTGFRWLITSCC
jgi:hypothetical protein